MPKTVTLASVQMNATPAPLGERLSRAQALVAQATGAGANIVLLPELFNLGYSYEEVNYERAELPDGDTAQWLKAQAREHGVYVAGSWLVRVHDHIFNRAHLVAPDGRVWHYDKHYPFLWERAFFREGDTLTVAETEYGNIGLMICWDSAHAELWRRYAGKVDLLLIPSCPPRVERPRIDFAGGDSYTLQIGNHHFADNDLHQQARWLGVPVAHSAAWGELNTLLPMPLIALGVLSGYQPELLQHTQEAGKMRFVASFDRHTKIIGADGQTLALAGEGDAIALASVTLPDQTPVPHGDQPPVETDTFTFFMVDVAGAGAMSPVYQRGARQHYGGSMSPTSRSTYWWSRLAVLTLLLGFILGRKRK